MVLVDENEIARVKDITNGQDVEAVVDFVGEGGAIEDGVGMLRLAGSYHVSGYGGKLNVATIDIISTEINFIGNCPIPDLLNKSLRENHRAKNSLIEKKWNYFKTASIITNKIKPVLHDVFL